MSMPSLIYFFFFFNDTATTEIYTLSLHDALPICFLGRQHIQELVQFFVIEGFRSAGFFSLDRKSTRLNSSHGYISYAVFCLKKKKKKNNSADYNLKHKQDEQHLDYD